jgi:hypothetical protein
MEIRETYCNKGVLDISSQRQLYWLNIAYVIPKSHPFRCKYDVDWKKVDRIKITNYSKQQAFGWRSTHGKLYGNKDFFRFGVKQSGKCGYCGDPRQSVEHLYTEGTYSQRLVACFERKFKLSEKLSEIEKLIGMDPSIDMSLIMIKRFNILRKCSYIARTYHTAAAAVHRLDGLAHHAAPLLHSVILLPATQPKGLHWQHTGQEVEKREQHLSYLP